MGPAVRPVLLGQSRSPRSRYGALGISLVLFVTTFAAYAVGIFAVGGGVVFVPGHAALVGLLAAGWAGYCRRGLVIAWLLAYGPLFGYLADHYLLGLSGRPFAERVAALVDLDGLLVMGFEALVFGTIGFSMGAIAHWGIRRILDNSAPVDTR